MKKILLGVSGSVAAIKTRELSEKLASLGEIRIVTTQKAKYFSRPGAEIPVYSDEAEWPILESPYSLGSPILHIELRRWADLLLIAPLSANTLAKISHGICDNLLTSVVRAWDWNRPLLVCPAMNTFMWEHPVTAESIRRLETWGATTIAPIHKRLACNDVGMGAMAEVESIAFEVKEALAKG